MESASARFYLELPVLERFFEASDPGNFHALPADWLLAVTDIVNSTGAIRENRYKSVNMLGAAPLAGMLNLTDRNSIPFIFGGDGAMIAVPPDLGDATRRVLAACKKVGSEAYGLQLRAALVPVAFLKQHGQEISVARFRVSEHYIQALFRGDGVRFSEQLLKHPEGSPFHISMPGEDHLVDFSGLECLWQEVKAPRREVITLLVRANPARSDVPIIYAGILNRLQEIYGFDDRTNPVAPNVLKMHWSVSNMMDEVRLRTFGQSPIRQIGYLLKAQVQLILGKVFMRLGYRSSSTDWGNYKYDFTLNSDHRKFDDMLRIVISGTTEQRQELEDYLQHAFEQLRLAYGMHVTDSAIVTCMVFNYEHEHIHFVDGNGGGYVMATRQLNKRMDRLRTGSNESP